MNKKYWFSRLGMKFTAVSTVALLLAYAVFLLGSEVVLPWVIDTDWYIKISHQRCEAEAQRFRDNAVRWGLTVDEVLDFDYVWDNPEFVYFTYEEPGYLDGEDAEVEIPCEDGTAYVCFFLSYEYHQTMTRVISTLLGFACLLLIILPYIYRIIQRVGKLSRDMEILAGGDLDHQVTASGRDELARLGQSMEEMRLSILDQISREREAVQSNTQLITALSHDLRTPLTKLTGYLEILQYDKCPQEERVAYLSRAREKAGQLRDMSDELFRYFQVAQEPAALSKPQALSGPVLLSQVLGEQCMDLQAQGLNIAMPGIQGGWQAMLRPEDIVRVFDNLFSNLRKYADPAQEIHLSWAEETETFILTIENAIRADGAAEESRGFGLPTARMLMARNGGSLEYADSGGRWRTTLRFPKTCQ